MKNTKEDFYISMLRYGKANLENGFRLDDLVKHLKNKGYPINSPDSILLHHYFPQTFYVMFESPYPDIISFYFLRPEAYFNLLSYENMIETKRYSNKAIIISIIAVVLTLASTILPYILK